MDVRAPEEYRRGHFPRSENIALFTDEERAVVGTLYHRKGREEAIEEGLKIVGPKMVEIVNQAKHLAPGKKILLYCWRGGMRSASVAWLLETAGFEVYLLQGGYKSFRRHLVTSLEVPRKVVVLGGMTGSGKTKILHVLREMGEQVIDLEGLACHKGSAFGGIGQPEQPTSEHFANLFLMELESKDPEKVLWLEDESYEIGHIAIPNPVFAWIKKSPLLLLEISRENRADRLAGEYGKEDKTQLETSIHKITRRLGGLETQHALKAIEENDFYSAAFITLKYYDESYMYGVNRRFADRVFPLSLETANPEQNAGLILNYLEIYKGKIFVND